MNYGLCLIMLLLISSGCHLNRETQKYTVGETRWAFGQFSFINSKGDTIRKLDPKKYTLSFSNTFEKFAIFGIKGKQGWYGIDIHENILFEVVNTSAGEISPDFLIEDKIRITDTTGQIGFANSKGKIIIKPQFEIVTHFSNGYAIIAADCKKVPWSTEGEPEPAEHDDCEHYSIKCKKHGYIDTRGTIINFGDYTFEEIENQIGWKEFDEFQNSTPDLSMVVQTDLLAPDSIKQDHLNRRLISRGNVGELIRRRNVGELSMLPGKIELFVCVDPTGKVFSAKFDYAKSSKTHASLARKAEEYAKQYVFEEDLTAPLIQCGRLTFIFNIK